MMKKRRKLSNHAKNDKKWKHKITLKTIYHKALEDRDDMLLLYLWRTKKYQPAGAIMKYKIRQLENTFLYKINLFNFADAIEIYNEMMKLKSLMEV